jgi:hypothetical protein
MRVSVDFDVPGGISFIFIPFSSSCWMIRERQAITGGLTCSSHALVFTLRRYARVFKWMRGVAAAWNCHTCCFHQNDVVTTRDLLTTISTFWLLSWTLDLRRGSFLWPDSEMDPSVFEMIAYVVSFSRIQVFTMCCWIVLVIPCLSSTDHIPTLEVAL